MPSGRDSFRRNRVAPFVLFYFTTLMTAGMLAWPLSGKPQSESRTYIDGGSVASRLSESLRQRASSNFFILPISDMRHQRHDGIGVLEASDTVTPDQTPYRARREPAYAPASSEASWEGESTSRSHAAVFTDS